MSGLRLALASLARASGTRLGWHSESASEFKGVATAPLPLVAPSAAGNGPTAALQLDGSVDDSQRIAAMQATTPDAKAAFKNQLEQKVYSGRASDTEIRMLIAMCTDLGDQACVTHARQIQAHRQGSP